MRNGRVAFRACIDRIERGLKAGHSMRAVYDSLSGELGFKYEQFTQHVHRHSTLAGYLPPRKSRKAKPVMLPVIAKPYTPKEHTNARQQPERRFGYDPVATQEQIDSVRPKR